MKNTRRLVILALMVSQALILSLIESWVIPSPIYGVKLGLANVITLIVIIFFGYREALLVVFVRCILSSIFGGGFVIFLFSLTGGILSTLVMAFLYKKMSKAFSLIGVSVAGSIMHNIGQILMAIVVMRTLSVLMYLPVLLVSGIIMGCVVGVCSNYLSKALRKINILSGSNQ